MDFMQDTLADGRCFRTLNIVDDFTRERAPGPGAKVEGPQASAEELQATVGRDLLAREANGKIGLDSSANPVFT